MSGGAYFVARRTHAAAMASKRPSGATTDDSTASKKTKQGDDDDDDVVVVRDNENEDLGDVKNLILSDVCALYVKAHNWDNIRANESDKIDTHDGCKTFLKKLSGQSSSQVRAGYGATPLMWQGWLRVLEIAAGAAYTSQKEKREFGLAEEYGGKIKWVDGHETTWRDYFKAMAPDHYTNTSTSAYSVFEVASKVPRYNGAFVLAFRGTTSIQDLAKDLHCLVSKDTVSDAVWQRACSDALRVAEKVVAKCQRKNKKLFVTGHSLGGMLAEHVAVELGKTGQLSGGAGFCVPPFPGNKNNPLTIPGFKSKYKVGFEIHNSYRDLVVHKSIKYHNKDNHHYVEPVIHYMYMTLYGTSQKDIVDTLLGHTSRNLADFHEPWKDTDLDIARNLAKQWASDLGDLVGHVGSVFGSQCVIAGRYTAPLT